MKGDWWENYDNLLELANFLRRNEVLVTASEAIYLFSKPWKWDKEWRELEALKRKVAAHE